MVVGGRPSGQSYIYYTHHSIATARLYTDPSPSIIWLVLVSHDCRRNCSHSSRAETKIIRNLHQDLIISCMYWCGGYLNLHRGPVRSRCRAECGTTQYNPGADECFLNLFSHAPTKVFSIPLLKLLVLVTNTIKFSNQEKKNLTGF